MVYAPATIMKISNMVYICVCVSDVVTKNIKSGKQECHKGSESNKSNTFWSGNTTDVRRLPGVKV